MKKWFVLALLLNFITLITQAQPWTDTLIVQPFENAFRVHNRGGEEIDVKEISISRNKLMQKAIGSTAYNTGIFNLYYENGWCSSAMAPTAKQTISTLFKDISDFISTSNPNIKINVWIRDINNMMPNASSSSILAKANTFYVLPKGMNGDGSILDNCVWTTINSGKDIFKQIVPPTMERSAAEYYGNDNFYFHIVFGVNFANSAIDWHSTINNLPASNQKDLYSVALHEMGKVLGMESLLATSGNSVFGANLKFFNRYDNLLYTTGNTKVISSTGACSMYGHNLNISASGLNSTNIPQYPYMDNAYTGGLKRTFTQVEKQKLNALGYVVANSYGNSLNTVNSITYSGSNTITNIVAAQNDGLINGKYELVCSPSGTVNLGNILNNDINATSFSCLEVINGLGTVSATSGNSSSSIVFTSNGTEGYALIRYTAEDANGNNGNTGYVGLKILAFCAPSICPVGSIIGNGDFEQSSVGNSCFQNIGNGVGISTCWDTYIGSADLCGTNCINPPKAIMPIPTNFTFPPTTVWNGNTATNQHHMFMGSSFTGSVSGAGYDEAIQTTWATPLSTGVQYELKFWYYCVSTNSGLGIPADPGQLYVLGGTGVLANAGNVLLPLPPNVVNLLGTNFVSLPNNGVWQQASVTFTLPLALNNITTLVLGLKLANDVYPKVSLVLLDDVTLIQAPAVPVVPSFNLPASVYCGNSINNLAQFLTNVPIPLNGTFACQPNPGSITTTGGITDFSPTATGTYTITYSYIDAAGCPQTLADFVIVGLDVTYTYDCDWQTFTLTFTSNPNNNVIYTFTEQQGGTFPFIPANGNVVDLGPSTYTIDAVDINGCSTELVVNLSGTSGWAPFYTIAANVTPNTTVCAGTLITLTGTCAAISPLIYEWTDPNNNPIPGGNGVTIPATISGVYTVTSIDANNCTKTATIEITVITPNINATASPPTICTGSTTTITPSGGTSYTITPTSGSGVSTTTFVELPTSSTTYTIIGVDANGCTATTTLSINVNPLPTVTATALPPTICDGSSSTITPSGAVTYTVTPINSLTVSPTVTTTYTITGTDANGCTASTTLAIIVVPNYTVNATMTQCQGNSINGVFAINTNAPLGLVSISPPGVATYTVTGANVAVSTIGIYTITVTNTPCAPVTTTVQILPCKCPQAPANAITLPSNTAISASIAPFNTGVVNGGVYVIDGTINVDIDLALNNTFIYLTPNTILDLSTSLSNPTNLLVINTSTIVACDAMWDRIQANTMYEQIEVSDSEIKQGIEGIHLSYNAKFSSVRSKYIDMGKHGVRMELYHIASPLILIRDNDFYTDPSTSNLLPPYASNTRSFSGISMQDLKSNIEIGSLSASNLGNRFERLNNGIHLYQIPSGGGNVTINFNNNLFKDIKFDYTNIWDNEQQVLSNSYANNPSLNDGYLGTALYVRNKGPLSLVFNQNINVNKTAPNTVLDYDNCYRGIVTYNANSNVTYQNMNKVLLGIGVVSDKQITYNIDFNNIEDCFFGINGIGSVRQSSLRSNIVSSRTTGVVIQDPSLFTTNFLQAPRCIDLRYTFMNNTSAPLHYCVSNTTQVNTPTGYGFVFRGANNAMLIRNNIAEHTTQDFTSSRSDYFTINSAGISPNNTNLSGTNDHYFRGYSFENCTETVFEENTATGIDNQTITCGLTPTSRPSTGMYFDNSPKLNIGCNIA